MASEGEIFAILTNEGWKCVKCGTLYESQWDATLCCPYEKREGLRAVD